MSATDDLDNIDRILKEAEAEMEAEYQKVMKYPEQVFGPKSERVYKIKNKTTGFYCNGGARGGTSKTGKVWRDKRAVSLHIALLREYQRPLNDLQLEEYELRFVGKEDLK